ncbi:lipoprotein [Planoprotostelium fungivorum]|uniref:Lipoprotein n=1 Tax=Planoprotostelium fungivorum TaxID=1890364 RepID=A0A2P6N0E9_9EUKA|nr:lipoprotein [Planoprotostelium fungivorum]
MFLPDVTSSLQLHSRSHHVGDVSSVAQLIELLRPHLHLEREAIAHTHFGIFRILRTAILSFVQPTQPDSSVSSSVTMNKFSKTLKEKSSAFASNVKSGASIAASGIKSGASTAASGIKSGATNLKSKIKDKTSRENSPDTPRREETTSVPSTTSSSTSVAQRTSTPSLDNVVPQPIIPTKGIMAYDLSGDPNKVLDLSNENYTEFPSEFRENHNLHKTCKRINISNNYIPTFPREFFILFENLIVLNISHNKMIKLPDGISRMTTLIELNLSHNNIDELPTKFGQLQNLRRLDLSWNRVQEFPPQFSELVQLRELSVSGNVFKKSIFPEAITRLVNLETLEMNNCALEEIPNGIGYLENLVSFDVSSNQLTTLPVEIGLVINLSDLNLADNNITSLPDSISQCTMLFDPSGRIDLSGSTLTDAECATALSANAKDLLRLYQGRYTARGGKMTQLPDPNAKVVPLFEPVKPVFEVPSEEKVSQPKANHHDADMQKKVITLAEWTVTNVDEAKAILVNHKRELNNPYLPVDQILELHDSITAAFQELASKRDQLPRSREPETVQLDDSMTEVEKKRKITENHIYNTNIILHSIGRHAATLDQASQLEDVLVLVKTVRAVRQHIK